MSVLPLVLFMVLKRYLCLLREKIQIRSLASGLLLLGFFGCWFGLVWGFYLWFHVCVCLVFVCFFHTHIPLRNTVQYKLMGEICYCNFIFIVLKYWPSASLSMHSATKKETY